MVEMLKTKPMEAARMMKAMASLKYGERKLKRCMVYPFGRASPTNRIRHSLFLLPQRLSF